MTPRGLFLNFQAEPISTQLDATDSTQLTQHLLNSTSQLDDVKCEQDHILDTVQPMMLWQTSLHLIQLS